ncbi:hypothetical protein BDQ17DRAFT_1440058 [Cyathus striatus]|nr:hypothetical protein BDQ17DRAFT_1440058 [Cyathus striatus]
MPAERGGGRNQYNPLVPQELVVTYIVKYWYQKKSDLDIWKTVRDEHVDTTRYSLGFTKFRKMRKDMGLLGVWQQGNTSDTIIARMVELRRMYPNAG